MISWLLTMLGHEFMRTAFVAGGAVAVTAGLTGHFLVLRGQVFAADALSHVAFTGALAALAFGLSPLAGLFVATLLAAAVLSRLGYAGGRANDAVIGSLFAWVLGLGVLFLSIFVTTRSTSSGAAGVGVLFGSVLGISSGQAALTAALLAGVTTCLLLAARPLLFATVLGTAAGAAGVPTRLLDTGFLLLLAMTAAEAVQVVGALLILGLLATPAAVAQRLTARPYLAMALSAAIALAAVWLGLALSYALPRVPPSFAIMVLLFGLTLAVAVAPRLRHGADAIRRTSRPR